MKIRSVAVNRTFKILCSHVHDMINCLHIQINYLVTFSTDKMIVRGGIAIEAVSAAICSDAVQFAEICQQGQIPIDGTKTDIRINQPYIFIDGISRWMIIPGLYKFFNRFSLTAVF